MAIYLYEFQNCKTRVELNQPLAADAYTELECPECGIMEPVKRLIAGGTAFRIGWRKTIYTPPGSRQTQVKRIGNKLYDQESYNAVRYGKHQGKRIKTSHYRQMKKLGRLDKNFKEV